MNAKEVSYIRRRFRAERSSINYVRGVFVNENKQILAEFCQFLGALAADESESILNLIRKTLSGTIGRNLIDVSFTNRQVLEGEEHALLEKLRKSDLKDESLVREFYQKAIDAIDLDGNYLLLLVSDRMDVIRRRDGEDAETESTQMHTYMVCSVCPVRASASALTFFQPENCLKNITKSTIVCPPIFGFMYPSFDDMTTNIYNALYYTKDCANSHAAFAENVLRVTLPMPAKLQKESFNAALAETMDADCDLDVVRSIDRQMRAMVELHKESRDPEPLLISKTEVKEMLSACGADEGKLEVFDRAFDGAFGARAQLPPTNLMHRSQFEVRTADAVIKLDPDKADLLGTRVIDGVKYLTVRAEGEVTFNGVPIRIGADGTLEERE